MLIQQRTAKYRGLGFVIAPRLKPFVRRWWYVSDRIAVLDLAIPCRDGTFCQCRVVNAYGPTSQRVRENPSVSEQFYAELNSAIKAPARFLVFVCGDFNSKLGKRTAADIEAGLDSCIGAHGMGTRNENGEALANFLAIHVFLPATQLSITQVATRLRGQAGSRIRMHHQVHLRQLPSTPKLTLSCVNRMPN